MSNKKLLLIEDDISLAELLIEYLSPEGYDITHAKTVEGLSYCPSKARYRRNIVGRNAS